MRDTVLAALVLMFACVAQAEPLQQPSALKSSHTLSVASEHVALAASTERPSLMGRLEHASHSVADRASELVVSAMGYLDVPYKRGGNTASTGFDCSGFVRAMYNKSAGLLLPRRAEEQAAATQKITHSDLQPGDLVFFNTMRRAFSHVGIYVGDGKFIHSPRSGAHVRVESMNASYWQKRFNGARRVLVSEAQTPAER